MNISEKKGRFDHLLNFIRRQRSVAIYTLIFILFGLLVFGIYSQTIEAPFVFDDSPRIQENRHIRLTELSPKDIVKAGFKSSRTRPVAFITFALNYYFGQYDPAGYHIVNILIHLLSGFFLFLFIRATFKTPALREQYHHPDLIAFLAALIWLAHPVQTQSVTYIVQRMNSMASMLFVLSFWSYVKGRLAHGNRKKWLWYMGSTLIWLVSLGCKQITVTLPVLVFIYEWYFFQDLSKDWFKRSLKWVLGITVCIAIIALIYTDFNPLEKLSRFRDFSKNEFTITQRALTQLRVVIYYISLLFYPHPSRLNLDYDFPLSYSLVNPITTLLSLFIILGLVLLSVYLAKRQRLISFCILWFFGNLVIESSVIPLALIFEHRIYMPSMFVFLLIVILLYRYIKPAWLTAVIACTLVALCSYWTFERNIVWQDELALWTDCSRKSPNKARPYTNMGKALIDIERYDEALSNFLKAIQKNPNSQEAQYNLGVLYEKQGDPNKSIEQFRKTLQINPNFVKAHNNLGVWLLKQNQTEEAIIHFQKALKIDPDLAAAHVNLGLALSEQDKLNAAVIHYRKALQISSNLPRAQFQLGAALVRQGRTEQGLHHIKRTLEIDPDHSEAHNNLGGHLLQEGKIDEALGHFNAALKAKPDMAEPHNNIGIILIHKGRIGEAIFHFQEAVRINPEFELAEDNLRRALAILQTNRGAEIERIQLEIKTRSDDPVLNYVLGNLYLGKGELNSAIGQYQKAISIQPDFPQALNNLAMAHTFGRQYNQAREVFQKLIALQPDNAASYYNVAVLYALQNKVTESLAWLNKAIAKGYNNWDLIKTDKDLENIRNSEGYRELIKGQ